MKNMKKTEPASSQRHFDQNVYILQGGGSLGAYQVGVLAGLSENNYSPNWLVGTSIGAIHAAIMVGNQPKDRIAKLKEFWEIITITTPLDFISSKTQEMTRLKNLYSAEYAALFGLNGFFTPRLDSALFKVDANASEISFYDTTPLRETLERLIDFDLLNKGDVRLSIGAVDVASGQLIYFDNKKEKIYAEHIMASSALPSGFPAIEIDGNLYWDGGIYSNTPMDLVMDDKESQTILCFIINLFNAYGALPKNLDEIEKRKKEILFGSRYKELIENYRYIRKLKRSIRALGKKLPSELQEKAEISKLLQLGCAGTIDIVRFHRKSAETDLSSKDYEFSISSATKYIRAGYEDVKEAVAHSPWFEPLASEEIGIRVHELSQDPLDKSSAGQLCSLEQ